MNQQKKPHDYLCKSNKNKCNSTLLHRFKKRTLADGRQIKYVGSGFGFFFVYPGAIPELLFLIHLLLTRWKKPGIHWLSSLIKEMHDPFLFLHPSYLRFLSHDHDCMCMWCLESCHCIQEWKRMPVKISSMQYYTADFSQYSKLEK